MKILNFGSCNIDIVYNVDHIVRAGETISVNSIETFVGGKGLNQSVALANAGAMVYHAGCIGNDGGLLSEFMRTAGVDLNYLQVNDTKTGQAIIQVDKSGENAIFLYPGANHEITEAYVDKVLEYFNCGDFLLLQNEINNIEYIIDKAYEKGMRIFFNPAPFNEKAAAIDLNKLYCIIPNEIECSGYTGTNGIDAFADLIKNRYPKLRAVVTLGKRGCVYIDSENILHQSAFNVDAVDTTAAGDTFVGYFIAQIGTGKTVQDAIKTACASSAITVSRKGAAPSIPNINEVEDFMNKKSRS